MTAWIKEIYTSILNPPDPMRFKKWWSQVDVPQEIPHPKTGTQCVSSNDEVK